VVFRIVHATANEPKEIPVYREQAVEVTLGPKAAFKDGNVGRLSRLVPAARVVNAVPSSTAKPKPPKEARTPRVTELLRKAIQWQGLLDSGEVPSMAEIAHREDLSRARVTQIMSLLRLVPDIRNYILSMPQVTKRPPITERALRPITQVEDQKLQVDAFKGLLG
jgi:hypothetical protein